MAQCNHCGSFVTDDYARVFGDNENRVEDCRNCPTVRRTAEEPDDGREVLLRDLREPASRDRDGTVAAEREAERGPDEVGEDGNRNESEAESGDEDEEENENEDGGRFQSRLSTMVSALRP